MVVHTPMYHVERKRERKRERERERERERDRERQRETEQEREAQGRISELRLEAAKPTISQTHNKLL